MATKHPCLLFSVRKPSSRHLYEHSTAAGWECGEMRAQWELITLARPLGISPSRMRPQQCLVTTTTVTETTGCGRATPELQWRRVVREMMEDERGWTNIGFKGRTLLLSGVYSEN
ncbi:hypothetical protein PBY51_012414 [Eleginops maclovinus]|uniref:Uncharacterized protein n=1 Tax=Eleginops maclovinus TaxID=56733 RepID=A0AAN7XQK7_ELEMC|nr:hypothetical protein PBY51_012414 [Eleginops maclovinus]